MELRTSNRLVDLSTEQCWEQLRNATVGRIAWSTVRGPVVLPVNFGIEVHAVHIRTRGCSEMVRKVDAERVAFEVDGLDEQTHTGWSVLARGLAEVRYDGRSAGPEVHPWPGGSRSTTVVISVDEISGRRIGFDDEPGPA